ncbi:MAG: MFS transporter [Hydrogenophilales bacterium]|nr:MFS transporter [Hydrogenophilales bacterium]
MNMLRALRHRNFRLFFFGQGTSLIGTWIQQAAMSWLVYRLTGSTLLLGFTAFAGQIPILLLAPVAGVWSDRFDRRKLWLGTQVLSLLQALALAGLAFSGFVAVWHIVVMAVLLGIITAFETPIRQSMMTHMVDDQSDLTNAIALNSFTVNVARLLGPTIAGLVIALVGEATCFLLNGLSYVAVIVALLSMRVSQERSSKHGVACTLKDGLAYAFNAVEIRGSLLFLALVSFMATPYLVLLPVYAKDVFHGSAQTLGFLMSSAGLGAIVGTVFLASRKNVGKLRSVTLLAGTCAGIALMGFALSTTLWVSLLLMGLVGFGVVVTAASTNMSLQTAVEGRFRGRVMAMYTIAYLGVSPLGGLAAGVLADHIGTPDALFTGGLLCALGGLAFSRNLLRDLVRAPFRQGQRNGARRLDLGAPTTVMPA